jgi:hypothetical protein
MTKGGSAPARLPVDSESDVGRYPTTRTQETRAGGAPSGPEGDRGFFDQ